MKLIEEFLYYSVGFAAQSMNKLTKLVQEMIEQGKLTKNEGKSFLDDYAQKAEELSDKFDEKLEEFVVKTMENFDYVSEEELKKAEQKIKDLEERINKLVAKQKNSTL